MGEPFTGFVCRKKDTGLFLCGVDMDYVLSTKSEPRFWSDDINDAFVFDDEDVTDGHVNCDPDEEFAPVRIANERLVLQ